MLLQGRQCLVGTLSPSGSVAPINPEGCDCTHYREARQYGTMHAKDNTQSCATFGKEGRIQIRGQSTKMILCQGDTRSAAQLNIASFIQQVAAPKALCQTVQETCKRASKRHNKRSRQMQKEINSNSQLRKMMLLRLKSDRLKCLQHTR